MSATNDTKMIAFSNSSPMLLLLLTGIILFTITIWTIVGNTLVIFAFIINKQIRQGGMSNYLIINLAISDLLLGIAVLPFSASYSTFGIWYFKKVLCEFWLIIDVLCSTASIWSLLMIAFDRYIATNYPIHYRHHRHSISLALGYICTAWFVSLVICLLPILIVEKRREIYSHIENKTIPIPTTKYNEITRQCELYKDSNFVITSSLLSFYIPLIIMIFLYAKVLYAIKQQSLLRLKTNSSKKTIHELSKRFLYSNKSVKFEQPENNPTNEELSLSDQQQLGRREISAEVRITRSLAIVIGCFICCWLPFFTLYIIRAVCHCLSFNAIEFFFWLGYSNSAINPVLYAILNKNFRVAFKNIFMSCRKICLSSNN